MRIRSLADLDLSLAWKRVLTWAQGGTVDIPDRLPFEVLARILGDGGPPLRSPHHLSPVALVVSSKKSGTSRVFARLSPADLTLYQALLDRLAPDIEKALPPRTVVAAYRQDTTGSEHAFQGTPSRAAFANRVQEIFTQPDHRYALTADVAGYFLQVDATELERTLYQVSSQTDVIRDLAELLAGWQGLGLRGLPQGIRPSSPLGNLYLRPVDRLLAELAVPYVRWMDDFVIATSSFHRAREVQDELERLLYGIGMNLAPDKTRITRSELATADSESAKRRLARIKRARIQSVSEIVANAAKNPEYPSDDEELPDPGELELEAIVEAYDELLSHLDDDQLPATVRPMAVEIFRDLGSLGHVHELHRIPRLLERAPDLTTAAVRYLVTAAKTEPREAKAVFLKLLQADRFLREAEKLSLCHGVLGLAVRRAPELAEPLGALALKDEHELIRARALLAWGAQSLPDDFSVVDRFWTTAGMPWRPYALVAIQSKAKPPRNKRYDAWGGSGRFLGALATSLKGSTLGWRKV